ncbi:DUF2625 family protein [Rummeliibacillus sp. SL167]|uniref:DUF2625 family protein n=1 Tax=Rummeliibacillus sp. SL167 TaxID=2579792 RepID=UPI0011B4FBC6|nr:DUF2625 family protein [Rummeliibacillus sp. SL167]
MKLLNDLLIPSETWGTIKEWIKNAINHVEVLSANTSSNGEVLVKLQVSTKSVLGSIIYNTGGMLIDNGWLRILGSGHDRLSRDISSWNQIDAGGKATLQKGSLLVADDAVGGFFALNGGVFDGEVGNIFYLAPDTLEWEDLRMGYADFINWSLNGNLKVFYEDFRWNNWKEDVSHVSGDKGILIYPYLWAEGEELNNRSKNMVPIIELWELNLDNRLRLGIL